MDIKSEIKRYHKSLGITIIVSLLGFILGVLLSSLLKTRSGFPIILIIPSGFVVYFFDEMIFIHKKLAIILRENNLIRIKPIYYGILFLVSWLFLWLFGFAIYLFIVNKHIKKLEMVAQDKQS